jgi:ABC-type phosphate transport system permease subunit
MLYLIPFLAPVRTIPATIAAEWEENGGLHYEALFALGCILFIITFGINMLVELVTNKLHKKIKMSTENNLANKKRREIAFGYFTATSYAIVGLLFVILAFIVVRRLVLLAGNSLALCQKWND